MNRAGLAIVAANVVLAGCTGQTPKAPASAEAHATTCRAGQLHASVLTSGSVMSQPFVTIALENTGSRSCELAGYPAVAAQGHGEGGDSRRLRILVRRGSIYERTDPGPHRFLLLPHESASFDVGTATAYRGGAHLLTIIRLDLVPPGGTATIRVDVRMAASRPRGEPIPVGVTALQPHD